MNISLGPICAILLGDGDILQMQCTNRREFMRIYGYAQPFPATCLSREHQCKGLVFTRGIRVFRSSWGASLTPTSRQPGFGVLHLHDDKTPSQQRTVYLSAGLPPSSSPTFLTANHRTRNFAKLKLPLHCALEVSIWNNITPKAYSKYFLSLTNVDPQKKPSCPFR